MTKTLVLKFGGAAVASPERFSRIAAIVRGQREECRQLALVVSAMGNMTNELIALAQKVNPAPPQREYDMLVTVGERISISLLAMALAVEGIESISFTGSQSGIITSSAHTDAKILDVRPRRLTEAFDKGKVVIVAGFQGVSKQGEITTLGRGGSDTSAVALGAALEAEEVVFYKDVSGIFSEDPKVNEKAEHFPKLTYAEALERLRSERKVLSARSIRLAEKNRIPLRVRSFKEEVGLQTIIAPAEVRGARPPVYEEEE